MGKLQYISSLGVREDVVNKFQTEWKMSNTISSYQELETFSKTKFYCLYLLKAIHYIDMCELIDLYVLEPNMMQKYAISEALWNSKELQKIDFWIIFFQYSTINGAMLSQNQEDQLLTSNGLQLHFVICNHVSTIQNIWKNVYRLSWRTPGFSIKLGQQLNISSEFG